MTPEDVRRIRSVFGWSQERLARELGVSFSTVNRWERGKTTPSPLAERHLRTLLARYCVKNKRNSPRVELSRLIRVLRRNEVSDNHNPRVFEGCTINVSIGGLMFHTFTSITKGETLDIDLDLPEADSLVRLVSRVEWIRKRNEVTEVGVRFIDISREDRERMMKNIFLN